MPLLMKKNEILKWRENYTLWESPCLGEGLHLYSHFDEKDAVKLLGGRWNPDPSGKGGHWYMPKHHLDKTCSIECDIMGDGWSGTVEHWLNNHKMIAGQYGKLDPDACHDAVQGNLGVVSGESTKYELMGSNGNITSMEVYPDLDIVQIDYDHQHGDGTKWLTIRDTRVLWDMLMKDGNRRIISASSEV